jgi:thiosulfate/3-mercaptopyruvate sulfurtransferase
LLFPTVLEEGTHSIIHTGKELKTGSSSMLTSLRVALLCACIFFLSTAENRRVQLLVHAEWLSEHLNDSDLVLIHVCTLRSEYAKGHIPGARFLWLGYISPGSPEESIGLPPVKQAKNILEELGMSNSSRVVLYGGVRSTALVTRAFLVLDYLGVASNVSILDGGLEAWKASGRSLIKEIPAFYRRGSLEIKITPCIVDALWVKAHLKDTTICIADSRGKAAFNGVHDSPARTGHISGAKNVASASMLDSLNKFKSPDEIRKSIASAGIAPGVKVVGYCNVGLSASILYFAAKLAGYDAAVYDGSWEDWAERGDDYPVETTPPASNPAAHGK